MLKTVEQFPIGHPDKLCDQVADAILDEFLRRDAKTRAHIDVFAGYGAMMISGDVASHADFDCAEIAKRVYKEAGYEDQIEPFVHLGDGSQRWMPSLAKNAAASQAVCYGYATKQTRELLPPAVVYAQEIVKKMDEARRHDASMGWMRPDGRVLVSVQGNNVTHVSVLCSHDEKATVQQVHNGILERVIRPVIGDEKNVKLFVNPAGVFTHAGLAQATGQSGRCVQADLYGGLLPHGHVVLSGRDPSDPSRAGIYMARHIAKSLVKSQKASQALVKLVYSPGRVDPIIVEVVGDAGEDLSQIVLDQFDLNIESIVEKFQLRKPIYRQFAVHGHFGRTEAPWETVTDIS